MTRHHDQTPSIQTSFANDDCSLVQMMEERGNPFEEESMDTVALDTKEITGLAAVEAVWKAKRIGQEQFHSFTREHLLDRIKPNDDTIQQNKLKVFKAPTTRSVSKQKQ